MNKSNIEELDEALISLRCYQLGHVCFAAQPCPILCDPMDCSLPGSSVHGIFEARILEWVAISSYGGILPTPGIEPTSPVSPVFQVDSLPAEPLEKPRCYHLGLDRFVKISLSFLLSLLLHFFFSASCFQVANALLLPGRANFLSCPGLKSYSLSIYPQTPPTQF